MVILFLLKALSKSNSPRRICRSRSETSILPPASRICSSTSAALSCNRIFRGRFLSVRLPAEFELPDATGWICFSKNVPSPRFRTTSFPSHVLGFPTSCTSPYRCSNDLLLGIGARKAPASFSELRSDSCEFLFNNPLRACLVAL